MKNDDRGIIGRLAELPNWIISTVLIIATLGVGVYAGDQYHVLTKRAEQAKQVAQAEPRPACRTVNALVIAEVDASMAQVKHSTEAQQDTWQRLTKNCGE